MKYQQAVAPKPILSSQTKRKKQVSQDSHLNQANKNHKIYLKNRVRPILCGHNY